MSRCSNLGTLVAGSQLNLSSHQAAKKEPGDLRMASVNLGSKESSLGAASFYSAPQVTISCKRIQADAGDLHEARMITAPLAEAGVPARAHRAESRAPRRQWPTVMRRKVPPSRGSPARKRITRGRNNAGNHQPATPEILAKFTTASCFFSG